MKKILLTIYYLLFTIYCFSQVAPIPNSPGSGNCLSYNGTSDYVDVPNIATYNFGGGDFSVEFWVNFNDLTVADGIINSWTAGSCSEIGWGIMTEGDARIYFYIGDGSSACGFDLASTASILNNKWYNVSCVRRGNGLEVYLNGILSATGTTTRVLTSTRPIMFGTRYTNFPLGVLLNGQIDEVRIWNTARTQAQIKDNMCHTLTGTEPGLVGYWPMDVMGSTCGGATQVCDLTGNGNNGTLQ